MTIQLPDLHRSSASVTRSFVARVDELATRHHEPLRASIPTVAHLATLQSRAAGGAPTLTLTFADLSVGLLRRMADCDGARRALHQRQGVAVELDHLALLLRGYDALPRLLAAVHDAGRRNILSSQCGHALRFRRAFAPLAVQIDRYAREGVELADVLQLSSKSAPRHTPS